MPTADYSSYHQNAGTTSDGAKFNNLIDAIQATVNAIDNNNVAAGAGIVLSKLGQSGAVTNQVPVWNGSAWAPGPGALYRKSTAKQVVNTVSETDLLNSEITVGANVLGTTGVLRLTAWGDWLNNTGGVQNNPLLKLKLGATTIFQAPAMVGFWSSGGNRLNWNLVVEIANAGVANLQTASFWMKGITGNGVGGGFSLFAAGQGGVTVASIGSGFGSYDAVGSQFGIGVDTTSAQVLAFTCTHGAANAALDMTLRGALVEVV